MEWNSSAVTATLGAIAGATAKWLLDFISQRRKDRKLNDAGLLEQANRAQANLTDGLFRHIQGLTDRLEKVEAALHDCHEKHQEALTKLTDLSGMVEKIKGGSTLH